MNEVPIDETSVVQKSNAKLYFLIYLIVLMVAAAAFFVHKHITELNTQLNLLNQNFLLKETELFVKTVELDEARKEIEKITCKGIWNNGVCEEGITVTSPSPFETYCLGDEIKIQWRAPSDMQSVTLYLIKGGLNGTELASYPASTNGTGERDGFGEVTWTIPNDPNFVGGGQTIRVNGTYRQTWITSNPVGPISIEKCT